MSKREKDKPRERRYIDQTSITDKGKKKQKKQEPALSTFRQADTKPAAAKGQKALVFFSQGVKRKGISAQC